MFSLVLSGSAWAHPKRLEGMQLLKVLAVGGVCLMKLNVRAQHRADAQKSVSWLLQSDTEDPPK